MSEIKKSKEETIFMKIIRKEIPADIVYEDALFMCFRDVNPVAPLHLLMVPKKPVAKLSDTTEGRHTLILGHMMLWAPKIVKEQGYDDFRIVLNNGAGAGQTVFHLHIHIIAGRSLQWPPG